MVVSAPGLDERDVAMFEGRAAQVDLISLLSTGDARGANSLLRCVGLVWDVAAAQCTSTVSCAILLSVNFF